MDEQKDNTPATSAQLNAELQALVSNPSIPKMYTNSFACALGTGDVTITLKSSNVPIAVLSLSFTGAKTLSLKLQELINHLELKSERSIMTTDEVTKFLKQP